jgi:hypothetical protein
MKSGLSNLQDQLGKDDGFDSEKLTMAALG